MTHDAILFIGFGGPEKREDIMPFLETVTRGRGIPKERLVEVAHHYEVIGGKSPINEITDRQAKALGKNLSQPVYVGNRNWHPFLEETLKKMADDGIQHATGFVTAAYRCEASWDRYLNAVEEARARIGTSAPVIEYVNPWFEHPLFIDAMCARLKEITSEPIKDLDPAFCRNDIALCLFTAHSIPAPMAAASQYVQELTRTAQLVSKKFDIPNWKLVYTSRSGAPTDPWLGPDISDELRVQAKQGVRVVLAIPIGFVADHVEVLFDLDIEAKKTAQELGVTLLRAKTVGDHPLFIQMIADVVQQRSFSEHRSA